MIITGGDGLAASLKALAAFSRPSTSFCCPAVSRSDGPTVVAAAGRLEDSTGVDVAEDHVEDGRVAEENGHEEDVDCTVEGVVTAATRTPGVDEDGTGAEKLVKIPDNDEASRL